MRNGFGTAGVLYISKCRNKVQLGFLSIKNGVIRVLLGFYSIENAKIRYGWGLTLLKMLK